MIWLLLITLLAPAQDIRRPTRRVPEKTATPTATPTPTADECAHCPDPESLSCAIAWSSCVQCWADCGQPIASPTPTQPPTPTRTPTPADPCAECPDPDSFTCTISWAYCVQCWEDCGQPIATPTPTPTVTPTPTPPPVGPECVLSTAGGSVLLVAIYAHETSPGLRYTYTAGPKTVPPGATVRPSEVEGTPVGYEWWIDGAAVKSCGDTDRAYTHIFSDGFESGDFSAWVEVVDGNL